MPLHNPLADCQTDPGSLVFISAVQPLKDDEDAIEILMVYSDTIVANRKDPILIIFLYPDMNFGRCLSVKFYRISDQILKDLFNLDFISKYRR